MKAQEISKQLHSLADPVRAFQSAKYFKTGKGEYGEGDIFIGLSVPLIRAQVKKFASAALEDTQILLQSAIHEERLFALLLLVRQFEKGDALLQGHIFEMYMNNLAWVNNWDLVDSSASQIVGGYLETRNRNLLYKLASSASLWERRVAIIATFYFIRNNQFSDSLALAEQLLHDSEDLIHKAVGWMLREIGKRDKSVLQGFLKKQYKHMPRTMLRYAIEKFPEIERKKFLTGSI